MLVKAPKFHEVAKRILEITENSIFVAHNTSFDYRVLKTEYNRLGYNFKRNTLCTVELSKKLIPNMGSYSLGKLTKQLGIPLTKRHRASGDADATVKLFKLLLAKDLSKEIIKTSIKSKIKKNISNNLISILNDLPNKAGIYYIHNDKCEIIYIGKSNNIKKRLNQHFTGEDKKSKKIQLNTNSVSYDLTGSELIALLKESNQIKFHKPLYNRKLRKNKYPIALFKYIDEKKYINFKISKSDKFKDPITTFQNLTHANSYLNKIVEKYQLCQKICGLYKTQSHCFNYTIDQCKGACLEHEDHKTYNERAKEAINYLNFSGKNFAIIDKGRDVDENSFILVEKGVFIGIGYFNLNYQFNNVNILKNILIPMKSNRDNQHIIQSYLRRKKDIKVVYYLSNE
jgi:DNA polymerase-3 subunit epsilon